MTPIVRPYRPADAERCCDVINDAVGQMDGLNDAARVLVRSKNTPDQLGRELQHLTTLVAESNGQVVGLGALDGDEIKRVYVSTQAQGRGVATVLMTALEAIALERGHLAVRLEASPSSVQFYESLGYVASSDDELTVGDAVFRFVLMTKQLVTHS